MAIKDHIPAGLINAVKPAAPLLRALQLWSEADGLRMSAAMSFYGILSLAPLLLLIVAMLGFWMDREMLTTGLVQQLGSIVGEQGSGLIKEALASAQEPSDGITATVIGLVVLAFGATGVFAELQDAFERVWSHGRGKVPNRSWRHTATLRLRGVAYILVFGFLMLISLSVSTMLNMFSGWAGQWLAFETLLRTINEVIGFLVCGGLFFGLMRLSGGAKPERRFLLLGAFVGAILFTIGRQVLTLYLSGAAVVSAYGAAGSLIVLLMWIYFSAAVLLFGAGCARSAEETFGNPVPAAPPQKPEVKRLQPGYRG